MGNFTIYKMSYNARKAFEDGEKLYHQWTKTEILERIESILSENEIVPGFDLEKLEGISETVLKKYMLSKSSWHHVNGRCTWFFVVNERLTCTLDVSDISRMIQWTSDAEKNVNKPKLSDVKITKWITVGTHQYAKYHVREAVVYDGYAYFKDGTKSEIQEGICSVVKECKSIVKEKRRLFEAIVRQMRLNYGVAI